MNEINYQEKVSNFQSITQNDDPHLAERYLEDANWDENEASKKYFKINSLKLTKKNENDNIEHTKIYKDLYKENLISNKISPKTLRKDSFNKNFIHDSNGANPIDSVKNKPKKGFFKKILSFFCGKSSEEEEDYNKLESSIFDNLPGRIEKLDEFTSKLLDKIGILIIYKENDREFENLIQSIKQLDHFIDIIRVNFILHTTKLNTNECKTINSQFKIKEVRNTPQFIFLSNKKSNNYEFSNESIIEKVQGYVTSEYLYEIMINSIEQVKRLSNHNQIQNSISTILTNNENDILIKNIFRQRDTMNNYGESNYSIIQEQTEEYNNLLKEEENKKRKIEEEERQFLREKLEKIRLEQEKEQVRFKKLSNLPIEPEEDHKESTKIVFRYSDGKSRSERRFLKSDKIGILYDYVDSLGNIFIESDKYELIQTFPHKVYVDKNKTLEEERLFPNYIIQIREI